MIHRHSTFEEDCLIVHIDNVRRIDWLPIAEDRLPFRIFHFQGHFANSTETFFVR